MYSLIKKFLFLFRPELAHTGVLGMLKWAYRIPGLGWLISRVHRLEDPRLARTLWGISFPNPVGLAAGFDKDGKYLKEMAGLGFGFIEIGTVTPRAQPGNPSPRLFRLPHSQALINRMGFNNDGLQAMVRQISKPRPRTVIIGGNLGKNKDTPNEEAWKDYVLGWETLYDSVDYFVINISSPNTPNLRALQEKEPLRNLLSELMTRAVTKAPQKPILVKISPDLSIGELDDIIDLVVELGLQGVVATNTSLGRENLSVEDPFSHEAGGLSGKPITKKSTEMIRYIHERSQGKFPIIGVGGIHSAQDALDKLNAGASLVQLYTGFIYEGPGLIRRIKKALLDQPSVK